MPRQNARATSDAPHTTGGLLRNRGSIQWLGGIPSLKFASPNRDSEQSKPARCALPPDSDLFPVPATPPHALAAHKKLPRRRNNRSGAYKNLPAPRRRPRNWDPLLWLAESIRSPAGILPL